MLSYRIKLFVFTAEKEPTLDDKPWALVHSKVSEPTAFCLLWKPATAYAA
jgi:hypothetical protein